MVWKPHPPQCPPLPSRCPGRKNPACMPFCSPVTSPLHWGRKKRYEGHREKKKMLLAIWTADKTWGQLELGHHHREALRGEGRMGVSWEAFSLSLCPGFYSPCTSHLSCWCSIILLSLSRLSTLMSSLLFPVRNFQQRTSPHSTSHVTPLSPRFFVLIVFI